MWCLRRSFAVPTATPNRPILPIMRGMTLVEAALTLAILAIVAGMSLPHAVMLRDRLAVAVHVQRLADAYQQARLAALLGQSTSILHVTPWEFQVWRRRGPDSVLTWRAAGPAPDGVTLTGPARAVFAPGGVTMGLANGTFLLSRGGVSRSVVVSRLGRMRVAPSPRRRRARPHGPRCSGSS